MANDKKRFDAPAERPDDPDAEPRVAGDAAATVTETRENADSETAELAAAATGAAAWQLDRILRLLLPLLLLSVASQEPGLPAHRISTRPARIPPGNTRIHTVPRHLTPWV